MWLRRLLMLSATLFLAGCAVARPTPDPASPGETVSVIGRGWHTELGLPAASLSPPLAALASSYPGVVTLTFGFGDRAFVLARHRDLADALGALFPNPGLILLTALKTSPAAAFGAGHVVTLHVSRAGLAGIERFVWESLATEPGMAPAPYGPGPYPGSVYYAASVPYDAFRTCNTWVAEALRSGGVPVQAEGVLFAAEIMREARRAAADPR